MLDHSIHMANILLLDDEIDLREEVSHFLTVRGHRVTEVGSIKQFQQFFASSNCDVAIIDRMLPDGDGIDLVSDLRSENHRCGIVMFTARDASKDRILGYKNGVDHYVTKPVRLEELSVIVESLVWRVQGQSGWRLKATDWVLTSPKDQKIKLTGMEHAFLLSLIKRPDKVLSRRFIAEALGKDAVNYDERNLDALILRLRKKVADLTSDPLPVKTVHGQGYTVTPAFKLDH